MSTPNHDDRLRADFNNGTMRRDYGPKGCAGIVYGAAAVATIMVSLLVKAVRK